MTNEPTPLQKAVEKCERYMQGMSPQVKTRLGPQLMIELLAAAKQLEALQAATGLCDKHKPNGGSRSCLVCGCEQMSFSLSRISYICGQPNEMKMSEYDTHYNCEEVVNQVEALQKVNEGLKRERSLILSELDGAYTGLMMHPSRTPLNGFLISESSKLKLSVIKEILSRYEQP